MNVYRNNKTGRLVRLFRVSPRLYTGSWLETEDIRTGETKKIPNDKHLTLVGTR